jgi:hypothetical protein
MAAIGASLRRGQSAYGTWRRGGGHRRRQRRIMHVLYVGAQGTAVALEDYAKDLRSRLRVDTQRRRRLELRATASPRSRRLRLCFPVSKSSSRLAARGGGTGATPERNLSTAGTPPRVQIEPVSSTPVDKLRRSLLAHQSRPNSIRSTFADSQGLRGELPSFVIDLPTLGLSHRGDSSLAVEHSAVRGRRGR